MNYTPKSSTAGQGSQNYTSNASTVENETAKMAKNAQDTMEDVKDNVTKTAKSLSSKVHKLFDSASDEISHASDTVTKEIRTNPVQSTVIALGVGYLLGKLLAR